MGDELAIVEDGVVVLAPRMNMALLPPVHFEITGNLDETTARRIAARSGGRPGALIGGHFVDESHMREVTVPPIGLCKRAQS